MQREEGDNEAEQVVNKWTQSELGHVWSHLQKLGQRSETVR